MLLLNYKPVLSQPTGIGVYADAVLPALQTLPHVLIPGGGESSTRRRFKRLAWTQIQLQHLARRHKASLIFTPAPEGYLGPQSIPQVVMVHDLRPLSHPERSFQSLYFQNWVPPLLKSCLHVLTNSQFTANEIQRCTGLPSSRITATPLGYDEQRFHPGSSNVSYGEKPYLLHVGQAYPHKNLRRLIQAFAGVSSRYPELRLVLAGKSHPSETPLLRVMVKELGLQNRVEFHNYVSYSQLPGLYRGAIAFVYPSLWEGFGLPILEAMACGTPVITSKGSGMEEVAGNAAILVDPYDHHALVECLEDLLEQEPLRVLYRSRGAERIRNFSWNQTRTNVKRLLESLP